MSNPPGLLESAYGSTTTSTDTQADSDSLSLSTAGARRAFATGFPKWCIPMHLLCLILLDNDTSPYLYAWIYACLPVSVVTIALPYAFRRVWRDHARALYVLDCIETVPAVLLFITFCTIGVTAPRIDGPAVISFAVFICVFVVLIILLVHYLQGSS